MLWKMSTGSYAQLQRMSPRYLTLTYSYQHYPARFSQIQRYPFVCSPTQPNPFDFRSREPFLICPIHTSLTASLQRKQTSFPALPSPPLTVAYTCVTSFYIKLVTNILMEPNVPYFLAPRRVVERSSGSQRTCVANAALNI